MPAQCLKKSMRFQQDNYKTSGFQDFFAQNSASTDAVITHPVANTAGTRDLMSAEMIQCRHNPARGRL
jgi:hypothetical protein